MLVPYTFTSLHNIGNTILATIIPTLLHVHFNFTNHKCHIIAIHFSLPHYFSSTYLNTYFTLTFTQYRALSHFHNTTCTLTLTHFYTHFTNSTCKFWPPTSPPSLSHFSHQIYTLTFTHFNTHLHLFSHHTIHPHLY